jgi:hypothetical protein
MTKRWIGTLVAAVALLTGLLAGAALTAAQGSATPQAGNAPHPAHIHNGTCNNLGDVVYPLNDVSGEFLSGTPGATPAPPAQGEPGDVIAQSQTEIDVSLDDLLAGEYAVNVHKSAEEIDVYIACGNITGEPQDGTLTVMLDQQNNSGVSGQALLTDLGNGKTEVTVTLADASAEAVGTPAATPSS